MTIDRATFFSIVGAFPTGVAIVTTADSEGHPKGLTSNAFSSVSAEPPLLLVCVDLGSRTLPALRHSQRFLVNFMGAGTADVCTLFASKATNKFEHVAWRPLHGGLPHLHEHAIAWALCSTEQEVAAGDHLILVGRVEDGEAPGRESTPLLYFRRTYGAWAAPQPEPEPAS